MCLNDVLKRSVQLSSEARELVFLQRIYETANKCKTWVCLGEGEVLKELYFSEILNMFKTLILVLYSLHNQRCLGTTVVKFDYKVEECSFFMPSFL